MSRRRLGVAALLASLMAPGAALPCSCMWAGPFTRVALRTELVVLGEVRAYHHHGMDVAVLEVLKGLETRPVIRIWGDTGALCRPYVTAFPRRSRWIFAVHRARAPESSDDYAISVCGEFWVEALGDQAVGRITVAEHGRSRETAPLADVLAWVRSGGATPLATRPYQ
jgi:hypothetical protein